MFLMMRTFAYVSLNFQLAVPLGSACPSGRGWSGEVVNLGHPQYEDHLLLPDSPIRVVQLLAKFGCRRLRI